MLYAGHGVLFAREGALDISTHAVLTKDKY